jgi:hypothetical protein
MYADAIGEYLGADRRIQRSPAWNMLAASSVSKNNVVHGKPSDGDDVDHRKS